MTNDAALDLLLKWGPVALLQGLHLAKLIKEGKGKTENTPEDFAILKAYAAQKGEDYFVTVSPTPPVVS